MKTFELNISEINSPGEIISLLEKHEASRGDTIKVFAKSERLQFIFTAVLMLVVVAVVIYFEKEKKKRQEESEKILDGLFKGKTDEEIEKQIETEYGIKIEMEKMKDDERKDWNNIASAALANAYADNEPDYKDVMVNESNPDYNPWKTEQL